MTPIGIGISSREKPIQYITLHVNGEIIRLFEMKSMMIGDALIAAGIPVKKLFGKPGMALTIKIDNELRIFPGEYGSLPTILLNNEMVTLDALIQNGDIIEVKAGVDGKDATLLVKDLLPYSTLQLNRITIENTVYQVPPLVEINGIDADLSSPVQDRDSILFYHVETIEEVLVLLGFTTIPYTQNEIKVYLNGEVKNIQYQQKKLYRNQREVSLQDSIHNGDILVLGQEEKTFPIIRELLQQEQHILPYLEIAITFNRKSIIIQPKELHIYVNKTKASLDDPIQPNSLIEIVSNQESHTFSDVFNYIDFSSFSKAMPKGATRYVLRLNGQPAEFYTPIRHGDSLELLWE
ncbi:hypothetical protein [Tepidibacillus marianensis]|uniref:hypothetical protein n=1 Tax=Tepidibacillus marianensis TaxID=3131995 RepID=UPI0030D3EA70